jgi:hypothetical protein
MAYNAESQWTKCLMDTMFSDCQTGLWRMIQIINPVTF